MERLTKTYSDGSFGIADNLPCGENSYTLAELQQWQALPLNIKY